MRASTASIVSLMGMRLTLPFFVCQNVMWPSWQCSQRRSNSSPMRAPVISARVRMACSFGAFGHAFEQPALLVWSQNPGPAVLDPEPLHATRRRVEELMPLHRPGKD